ncbi:MAG: MFS transporter [Lentisphaeria bacterium]|nr:MAG: MFS transporter [Lentisphaeria bacterium]
MILKGPLSAARQASSQRNYSIFNAINGLSYMCLGETVLILLAVRLECPDYFISALGAMIYFGYLLLPLGKVVAARVGAARSQSIFWMARNAAALMVATAPLFCFFDLRPAAMAMLLIGAFLFYGFRAAGLVMSQPLIGEITDDLTRPRVIAVSIGLFYLSCLFALLAISLILRMNSSLWVLTAIIVVGACCGFTASRYISRIDETESLRESARKPILQDCLAVFRDTTLRRLILSGFLVNLAIIMTIPVSMLALKRGYLVSDTDALLFALVQFGTCAGMSFLSGKIAVSIGPRKMVLLAYAGMMLIGLLWLCAPASRNNVFLCLPFFVAGAVFVGSSNAITHYFLQTTPPERRVAGSIFISLVTGVGAGISGMALAGLLLDWCTGGQADSPEATRPTSRLQPCCSPPDSGSSGAFRRCRWKSAGSEKAGWKSYNHHNARAILSHESCQSGAMSQRNAGLKTGKIRFPLPRPPISGRMLGWHVSCLQLVES